MSENHADELANAIGEHVVKHIGPVTNVFHEIQGDLVQVDILVVGPQEERPYTTLITCGMSDRPMRVPLEDPDDLALIPELRLAELLLALPSDWPLTPEAFQDEANYWPVRWLKRLARLPHQMGGWLGLGHTIPNGDPPRPLAPNVSFAGWLIDEPVRLPQGVCKLRVMDRAINFYSVVPLTAAEMAYKVTYSGPALGQLLDRAKVSEVVDVNRGDVTEVS